MSGRDAGVGDRWIRMKVTGRDAGVWGKGVQDVGKWQRCWTSGEEGHTLGELPGCMVAGSNRIFSSIQAQPPGKKSSEEFTVDKDNKEEHEDLLVMD